jgi:hypothetical protein
LFQLGLYKCASLPAGRPRRSPVLRDGAGAGRRRGCICYTFVGLRDEYTLLFDSVLLLKSETVARAGRPG